MFHSVVRRLWNPSTEEFFGDDLVVRICFTQRGAWKAADRYREGRFKRVVEAERLPHPNAVWIVRDFESEDFEKYHNFLTVPNSTVTKATPNLADVPAWGSPEGLSKTAPRAPKRPASVAPDQLAVDGMWGPRSQQKWQYTRTIIPLPEKIFPEDTTQGVQERNRMIREREALIREVQRQLNKES